MNTTARILSIAAAAAFASFGAQANDLCGAYFDAGVQSTRTRAEVSAEAAQAVTQFKNYTVVDTAAAPFVTDRAAVRAQAIQAARQGQISLGERG